MEPSRAPGDRPWGSESADMSEAYGAWREMGVSRSPAAGPKSRGRSRTPLSRSAYGSTQPS